MKLVSLVLAEFLLTYSFVFIVSAVKATRLIGQELVMNLFYSCIVQTTLFFTNNNNKQPFYEEWDSYTSDTMA